MSTIEIIKIREGFYSFEFGTVRCFMFVGLDRVLLVDAGFPGRGLIDKVREITDLPIEIIYSHTDGDHRGDIELFDRPFIHPSEIDYLKTKQKGNFNLRPVWEGQIIQIGSYELEIVLIPGHTPGSIGLIERNKRFMLTGDTVHYGPVHMFGPGRNLLAYRFSLLKLKEMLGSIDVFYACHHQLEVTPDVLDDLLEGINLILDKKITGKIESLRGKSVTRYSYKKVSFYT